MTATADYLDSLSRFACQTSYADIPQAVRERSKVILADLLAVIAAGMQEPETQALVANQVPRVASGRSTVIGTGKAAIRSTPRCSTPRQGYGWSSTKETSTPMVTPACM